MIDYTDGSTQPDHVTGYIWVWAANLLPPRWVAVPYGSITAVAEPVRRCSRCGNSEDDQTGSLTDVRVTIANGEEGYAEIVQLVCDECLDDVSDGLRALGFSDHRHGGINFLEDGSCPGVRDMNACPTPSEYGPQLVTPDGLQPW